MQVAGSKIVDYFKMHYKRAWVPVTFSSMSGNLKHQSGICSCENNTNYSASFDINIFRYTDHYKAANAILFINASLVNPRVNLTLFLKASPSYYRWRGKPLTDDWMCVTRPFNCKALSYSQL